MCNAVSYFFTKMADFVAPINPVTEKRGVRILPQCVEVAIGTLMYKQTVRSQGGELSRRRFAGQLGAMRFVDPEKVQTIFERLCKETKRSDLPYEVKTLRSSTVNAWCLPGGKVAICQGLLKRIQEAVDKKKFAGYIRPDTKELVSYEDVTEEDVIAAVLGHEITHADARHAARKLEWTGIVQAIIFGISCFFQRVISRTQEEDKKKATGLQKIHDVVFSIFIKLGIKLFHFAGSRDHELEADQYGTQLAERAGYNPIGALLLQDILKDEAKSKQQSGCIGCIQKGLAFFSAHPSPVERQEELGKMLFPPKSA